MGYIWQHLRNPSPFYPLGKSQSPYSTTGIGACRDNYLYCTAADYTYEVSKVQQEFSPSTCHQRKHVGVSAAVGNANRKGTTDAAGQTCLELDYLKARHYYSGLQAMTAT